MVEITLNHQSGDHLRGKLHVDVIGFDPLARLETGEITLTGDSRRIRLMLPPLNSHIGIRSLDLRLSFVSDSGAIDLGTHVLPMPDRVQRSLVVAICDESGSTVGAGKVALGQSLRLERFVASSVGRNALVTWPSILTPGQLPAQPTGYCCYDMLVLLADGFARAEGKQLDAIRQWALAGGSLLVISDGGGLESRHLDFLDALAARDAKPRTFGLKAGGGLLVTPAPPRSTIPGGAEDVVALKCELGRCVVVVGAMPDAARFASEAWLETAGFLWRVHPKQLEWVRLRPGWTLATHLDSLPDEVTHPPRVVDEKAIDPREGRFNERRDSDFSMRDGEELSWLTATLMPRNIRVIPFGTVVLILLGFTVVIGPLDYFVLGLFRGRRFTWITFPLMCVAFTFMTVWTANRSMGKADRGKTLVINDVGEDGRVLRQTRFELAFAGRDAMVETTMTGGLYAPVNTFGVSGYYDYRGYDDEDGPGNDDAPPVYAGWLTGQHTVTRLARQWTPTMGRITAIAPPVVAGDEHAASVIDWRAAERVDDTETTLSDVRKALRLSADAHLALLRPGAPPYLCDPGMRRLFQTDDIFDPYIGHGYRDDEAAFRDVPRLLANLCVMEATGIFKIVSAVSPLGIGAREGLTLLLREDAGANTRIILVVQEHDEQIIVFRRRYER